ncbi:MAG: ATP-binding cassette domain-containing protein [Clostridia bacterium]|nr:ATP-binding cassette domain-containing protein [Clostridia bacterium]
MIKTEDLFMRFSDGSGIRYRDMCFDTGRSYALLGASGVGKSTLLNLISGVLTTAEGRVSVDGEAVSALPQKARDLYRIRRVGYIFQDFKLLEDMTVQDNINILRLEGVDTSDMDALLDRLGILRLKKRRVNRLSGGEKQRVAIARALIKKPAIILADEPTGNLNYDTGVEVVRTLLANAGEGTLIAVTHDDRLAPMFDERMDMNAVAEWVPGGEAHAHA